MKERSEVRAAMIQALTMSKGWKAERAEGLVDLYLERGDNQFSDADYNAITFALRAAS